MRSKHSEITFRIQLLNQAGYNFPYISVNYSSNDNNQKIIIIMVASTSSTFQVMSTKTFASKITKSLKKRFSRGWMKPSKSIETSSIIFDKPSCNSGYESLDSTDPHQDELDENALNEALEARLMELIASSPIKQLEVPITFQVGSTSVLATAAKDPLDMTSSCSTEINKRDQMDLFDYGTYFCLIPSQVQTCCQIPQGQVPQKTC